jgi:hypothetical protein
MFLVRENRSDSFSLVLVSETLDSICFATTDQNIEFHPSSFSFDFLVPPVLKIDSYLYQYLGSTYNQTYSVLYSQYDYISVIFLPTSSSSNTTFTKIQEEWQMFQSRLPINSNHNYISNHSSIQYYKVSPAKRKFLLLFVNSFNYRIIKFIYHCKTYLLIISHLLFHGYLKFLK